MAYLRGVNETTETAAARNAYRALRAFSRLDAGVFQYRCERVIHEIEDGEGEGSEKWTPALWLRAAKEVTWDETTRSGRDRCGCRALPRVRRANPRRALNMGSKIPAPTSADMTPAELLEWHEKMAILAADPRTAGSANRPPWLVARVLREHRERTNKG